MCMNVVSGAYAEQLSAQFNPGKHAIINLHANTIDETTFYANLQNGMNLGELSPCNYWN